MTHGALLVSRSDKTLEASCGPDGWESSDKKFGNHLNAIYPAAGTPAGSPWVRAFWRAVEELSATVVAEPETDDTQADVVY